MQWQPPILGNSFLPSPQTATIAPSPQTATQLNAFRLLTFKFPFPSLATNVALFFTLFLYLSLTLSLSLPLFVFLPLSLSLSFAVQRILSNFLLCPHLTWSQRRTVFDIVFVFASVFCCFPHLTWSQRRSATPRRGKLSRWRDDRLNPRAVVTAVPAVFAVNRPARVTHYDIIWVQYFHIARGKNINRIICFAFGNFWSENM